ncbi:phosphoglucomutase/phosphomannomutase PgmG [Novosphingobium sp. 9]|uniref:phosphoglucomutase/phosphomannomutase PgmG n=1 Tax=Novosphingobium sp. 9 TaxID=2025349 RepID=UPI0021B67C82|nr:phosphomannomutase/phosphoglucomutase [Novosphingobium sp. 9]
MTGHSFHPTLLREYDVRGVVDETLHEADAWALGRAFAATVVEAGLSNGRIAVCRDGRLSSPMLEAALVEGLCAGGIDVVRIGMGPTPMLYFAEASMQEVVGGIQVTGSHNPKDHNGFKIVLAGRPVFGADLQRIGEIAACGFGMAAFGGTGQRFERAGGSEGEDILPRWIEAILRRLGPMEREAMADLRIGWDTGNGAAGPAIELLTSQLPGEHHLLFTSVDGTFPNHHPDPSEVENLADLQALVAAKSLHFGCAFDGDADRLGVVDAAGRPLAGDQLLAIYALDLLLRHPGAQIVADIKSSAGLESLIRQAGGRLDLWKAGHSHIKSRMKETGALLGGETTGHVFLAEDWYGFDDGVCAAVELIAAQARLGQSVTALHAAMPTSFATPELRVPVSASRKFATVDEVRARLEAGAAAMVAIDGVRVNRGTGWWLLRASNTQEVLSLRAEAAAPEGLEALLAEIEEQLALSGLAVNLPRG